MIGSVLYTRGRLSASRWTKSAAIRRLGPGGRKSGARTDDDDDDDEVVAGASLRLRLLSLPRPRSRLLGDVVQFQHIRLSTAHARFQNSTAAFNYKEESSRQRLGDTPAREVR